MQQWFTPLVGDFARMPRGDIGYGAGYGGSENCRFKALHRRRWSVRGYEQSSWRAPRDAMQRYRRQAQRSSPMPSSNPVLKGEKSARASIFADAGQIYLNNYKDRRRV